MDEIFTDDICDVSDPRLDKIIVAGTGKFMATYVADENSRYRSFDHVHSVFRNFRDYSNDELSLYLYMFLASWGMFRGSSFMLSKDYKFLTKACTLICDSMRGGGGLMDVDPFDGCLDSAEYVDKVLALRTGLEKCFTGELYYKSNSSGKMISEVSDTLTGKIMLATLGCVPAYDGYVKKALVKLNIGGTISNKSLSGIWKLAKCHESTWKWISKRYRREAGIDYPVMKYVDMALWEYGFFLDRKNRKVEGTKANGQAED